MSKRLPMTPEERLFLKSIENNAMVVLLMFKIYPQPLNSDALAFEMKWDSRRAKKMLDDLSSDGFTALMKGQGYVLTSQTRHMIVNFFGTILSLPLEAQALAQPSQVQAQAVLEAGAESTHIVRALEEVEESSLILELKDSSTSPSENTKCASTAEILAATPILFGDPGVLYDKLDLKHIKPHYALGWVAQAYDQRKRKENPRGLDFPASLVFSRLLDEEAPKPRAQYYIDPDKYLPNAYLEVLGRAQYVCETCQAIFTKQADFSAHEATHAEEVVESVSELENLIPLAEDHRGYQLWAQVCAQLQGEMPRGAYNTWVRDVVALDFDGQVLTVGVMNSYAKDWLESRVMTPINRLLSLFCNADVSIQFVVYGGGE